MQIKSSQIKSSRIKLSRIKSSRIKNAPEASLRSFVREPQPSISRVFVTLLSFPRVACPFCGNKLNNSRCRLILYIRARVSTFKIIRNARCWRIMNTLCVGDRNITPTPVINYTMNFNMKISCEGCKIYVILRGRWLLAAIYFKRCSFS